MHRSNHRAALICKARSLRPGRFRERRGGNLEQGAHFTLETNDAPGDASRVHPSRIPEIPLGRWSPANTILIDDGKLRLEVEEVAPGHRARAVVRVGGKVLRPQGRLAARYRRCRSPP